ncbi:hypothetical protein [Nannocystis pusilla]|uniref:hypothetical protein n=1 Tax=Nannocystis pusilla TaxID=889268 RepID=UPI003B7BD721
MVAAVRDYISYRSSGIPSLGAWRRQLSLIDQPATLGNPIAERLLEILDERRGPIQLSKMARHFASEAAQSGGGQISMLAPKSPLDALNEQPGAPQVTMFAERMPSMRDAKRVAQRALREAQSKLAGRPASTPFRFYLQNGDFKGYYLPERHSLLGRCPIVILLRWVNGPHVQPVQPLAVDTIGDDQMELPAVVHRLHGRRVEWPGYEVFGAYYVEDNDALRALGTRDEDADGRSLRLGDLARPLLDTVNRIVSGDEPGLPMDWIRTETNKWTEQRVTRRGRAADPYRTESLPRAAIQGGDEPTNVEKHAWKRRLQHAWKRRLQQELIELFHMPRENAKRVAKKLAEQTLEVFDKVSAREDIFDALVDQFHWLAKEDLGTMAIRTLASVAAKLTQGAGAA